MGSKCLAEEEFSRGFADPLQAEGVPLKVRSFFLVRHIRVGSGVFRKMLSLVEKILKLLVVFLFFFRCLVCLMLSFIKR